MKRIVAFIVKRVHNDNMREYRSIKKDLRGKYEAKTSSTPYTSQSNWFAEHMKQTIMDRVRAMLKKIGIHWRLWKETIMHVALLQNFDMSAVLNSFTPLKSMFRRAPDNSRMLVSGFSAYVHTKRDALWSCFEDHLELRIYIGIVCAWLPVFVLYIRKELLTQNNAFLWTEVSGCRHNQRKSGG